MATTPIQDKRREARLAASLPVSFRLKDSSGVPKRSLIKDLSSRGLRLITNNLIPKHSSILLELELKELPHILNMAGRIAWIRNLGLTERYHIGVEFQDINKETKHKLEEYLQLQSALSG